MTTSLGKRSSTNGISDIAYSDEKAPIYTSTNQFVQGTKTYNDPQKFLSNVLCSGHYYGDGSHLTNLPIVNDPTKLPLAGGTMTGALTMDNVPINANGNILCSGYYYGDGSNLTNLPIVDDPSKLPLAGGTMTGALTMDNVPININGVSPAIIISDGTLTGTLAVNGLLFTDPDNSLSSAFTESLLNFTYENQTIFMTASLVRFTDSSNLSNFKFQTDNNFFKYECGASYRNRQHDGQQVRKDDAIIVTAIAPSDYNFFTYDYYLDADGLGGFSFIIINPGGITDPNIHCDDIFMVTRDFGTVNNFTLPKWSTARFILTPTDPAIGYPNNFVWMVSF